jgi:hypothetical protein
VDPAVIEALNYLKKRRGGVFEAYHVLTFDVVRSAPGDDGQEVCLQILDGGPDPAKEQVRYRAILTTEEGHRIIGGRAQTVSIALAIVRWDELDLPPRFPKVVKP